MPNTISPEQALIRLKEGNRRFFQGRNHHPNTHVERRREVVSGQNPFATILTCSDSRVPPEILFDAGIGDLFVIRVAGNIVGLKGMASMEYAVHHLQCPLIVVLGHESCGAVTAAIATEAVRSREPEGIRQLLDRIRDNIPDSLRHTHSGGALVNAAARENMATVVGQIRANPVVAERIASAGLMVLPGFYSLATGEMDWT